MHNILVFILFGLSYLAHLTDAHGYLIVPPNRGSAWREDPARFPPYYQDNALYCGDSYVMMNAVNSKHNKFKIFFCHASNN